MKKRSERIIHLDDMLRYLTGWWKILIAGIVIVGIIFGGIGFYKADKAYRAMPETPTASKMEISVADSELVKIDTIFQLERLLENQKDYYDNSILMRVNPFEKKAASVQYRFCVSGDMDFESAEQLLEQGKKAYQGVLNDGEFYEYIKDAVLPETEPKYIKELINSEMDSKGIIVINAIAPDEDTALKIRGEIKNYLSRHNEEILKNYKDLRVKTDKEYTVTTTDAGLQGTQMSLYGNIQNLQSQIDSLSQELSDGAGEYLELARRSKEEGTYEPGQTFSKEVITGAEERPDNRIQEAGGYAVKRILLFVFLFVICLSLKYMWAAKLMCAYDLSDMYGMKVFDGMLTEEDDRISAAAEKILMSGEEMIITSSDKELLETNAIGRLKRKLEEKGAFVRLVSETENAAAIKEVKKCNNIILVESIGKSRYSRIRDIVENLRILDKDVKGVVIIKD